MSSECVDASPIASHLILKLCIRTIVAFEAYGSMPAYCGRLRGSLIA